MRVKEIFVALLLGAVSMVAHAEPRWCTITGRAASDRFEYPPIARAARVSGVVLSMVTFSPDGRVLQIDNISGPRMLADLLRRQISGWTLKTNAKGEEECKTLVIAHYRIHNNRDSQTDERGQPELPSILQLYVDTEPLPFDTSVSASALWAGAGSGLWTRLSGR